MFLNLELFAILDHLNQQNNSNELLKIHKIIFIQELYVQFLLIKYDVNYSPLKKYFLLKVKLLV